MTMKPTKDQAKAYLQEALDEIPSLGQLTHGSTEFIMWRRDTRTTIENIFNEDPGKVKEFDSIRYTAVVFEERLHREEYQKGLNRASAILESMINEIDRWWPDAVQASPQADAPGVSEVPVSNRVFVVIGRDEAATQTMARHIEGLGLEPIILREQPSEGRTVIEKFEEYAQVGFAVVLCTPDDVGALESEQDNLKPRPRQNVVFELGFFLGKIGRNRVCVLFKEGVDMPSDYAGVIYIQMDDFGGWRMKLAKEMKAAGLPVDMDRLLSA